MNNYINEIEGKQQKGGGFPDSAGNESAFYTSLILSCLNRCRETSQVKTIKQKAAGFILSQKSEDWIFSKDASINFCALSALAGYDKEIITGEAIAKILKNLILIELKEGGPYYSLFGGNGEDRDKNIDLGANAGIACFLYSQEVDLPNLNFLIESAIDKNEFKSDIFHSVYPVIYFISQFYKGGKKNKLMEFLLIEKNKGKYRDNPLNASMAISALLNLGYPAEKLGEESDYLKKLAEKELRSPYPLEKNEFSTAELNVAFYLEALEKLGGKNDYAEFGKRSESEIIIPDKEEKKIFTAMSKLAEERFSTLRGELKAVAAREIQRTIKGNIDKQMSLMPYYFKKALGKKAAGVSDDMIVKLGLANVFYWTAFIIYDDISDEEGDGKILPAANFYIRSFNGFFGDIFQGNSEFVFFFRELMDNLDGAHAWQMANCRAKVRGSKIEIHENPPDYGDYSIVYEPVSAHIAGPIAMLCRLGYEIDSPEIRNLVSYFKNYLIAMQINDDMLDWEEDLKKGHLSTVVAVLLEDFGRKKGGIDTERDLPELKKIFLFRTLPEVCRIAMEHTEKSRRALNKMTILENPAPLERFITITEDVAKNALKRQKYTADFLKAY